MTDDDVLLAERLGRLAPTGPPDDEARWATIVATARLGRRRRAGVTVAGVVLCLGLSVVALPALGRDDTARVATGADGGAATPATTASPVTSGVPAGGEVASDIVVTLIHDGSTLPPVVDVWGWHLGDGEWQRLAVGAVVAGGGPATPVGDGRHRTAATLRTTPKEQQWLASWDTVLAVTPASGCAREERCDVPSPAWRPDG